MDTCTMCTNCNEPVHQTEVIALDADENVYCLKCIQPEMIRVIPVTENGETEWIILKPNEIN